MWSGKEFMENNSYLRINRYSYVMNNPLKYIDPSGWGSEGPGSNGGGLLPDDLPSGISNPVPYGGGDSNILPNWNTLWYSNCWSGNYLSGSMSVSWSNGSGGTTPGSGLGDNAFISATNSSPVSLGNTGFSGGPRGQSNTSANQIFGVSLAQGNSGPTEFQGAFIEKRYLYDYMLMHAVQTKKEVVSLELVKNGETKYFVLPWHNNTISESNPHLRDLENYVPGYTKTNVTKIFHTHPKSTPPSNKDKAYGDFYNVPIYTVGANGSTWIYFNKQSKTTNLELYLAK